MTELLEIQGNWYQDSPEETKEMVEARKNKEKAALKEKMENFCWNKSDVKPILILSSRGKPLIDEHINGQDVVVLGKNPKQSDAFVLEDCERNFDEFDADAGADADAAWFDMVLGPIPPRPVPGSRGQCSPMPIEQWEAYHRDTLKRVYSGWIGPNRDVLGSISYHDWVCFCYPHSSQGKYSYDDNYVRELII